MSESVAAFPSTNLMRILEYLKSSCSGPSEKPEEILSSKYFCIIVWHDFVRKQLASTSERSDSIYCVLSARSEVQVIYIIYDNYYIQWLFLYS